MLGSFPSPKSREAGFYYAHPRNRFWPLLCRLLGCPTPPDTAGRKALCLSVGLALWDVVGSCTIIGASDSTIEDVRANDLSPLLSGAPIRKIFTTGAAAARLYRQFIEPISGRPAESLPSTSPANAAWTFPRLLEAYRPLADALQTADSDDKEDDKESEAFPA
ncbi:DNA-deoxyinosine glycosylase [Jonquetella sp. BV3C21]|nr:DNA-deoxyinosine glycosylase [Jonquetella sp. BV3C21]